MPSEQYQLPIIYFFLSFFSQSNISYILAICILLFLQLRHFICFSDRSRSVVNLNTQLTGAIVTDKFFGNILPKDLRPSEQKQLLRENVDKDINIELETKYS